MDSLRPICGGAGASSSASPSPAMTSGQGPDSSLPGAADQLEAKVHAACVRLLYDRNLPAIAAVLPFTALVCWLLWHDSSHAVLLGWAAAKTLAATSLIALDRLYRRLATEQTARQWGSRYTVALALDGLSWSALGVMLAPPDRIDLQAIMVACIVGVASVAAVAHSVMRGSSVVFSAALLLPPIAWQSLQGTRNGLFAAAGMVIFLVYVVVNVRRSSQATRELLELRFEMDAVAERRAEALAVAQHHSAVKSQFLATMSHEMRTPLHGMLGTIRLMREELEVPAERERLALVERSGQHLLGLIDDVLDFSRIEAGEMRVAKAPFDLAALLRDLVDLTSATAAGKGLRFVLDSELGDTAWASGDVTRVRQVLLNLVGNALKFTDSGSIRVHARTEADRLRISVADTGIGIAPEDLARVFEPFQQADNSYARRYSGTGLGLSISRELVRAMGGDIVVQSRVGEGTTFTVELPWISCEPPAVAVVPHTPSSAHERMAGQVLLAEDNPVNVMVARAMLEKLGLTVTVAKDGRAALDSYRAALPDIVLMDCHMPEMDGFEATREIRSEETRAGTLRVPVVAVTANALAEDRERCLNAGMDDYLAKPFTADQLRSVLERHLARRAA